MSTRKFQIIAIIAAVAVVGTVGLTAVATGGDSSGPGIDLMGQLHKLGSHLHGGDHHQAAMTRLFDELQLTPDQRRRFENVRAILDRGSAGHGSMAELHDRLVQQLEQDRIGTDEIRRVVDEHVEQIRSTVYAATDEMIALVQELDAEQRQTLLEHLKRAGQGRHGLGH